MSTTNNSRFPLPDARDPETKSILFELQQGIADDNGATPWYSVIPMGTPGQLLKFAVDTGTTHSWVTSARCTTDACLMHRRFFPNDSSTYKPVGSPRTPTTINFGPWGELKAFLGRDYLALNQGLPFGKKPGVRQLMRLYLSTFYQGEQFEDLVWDGGIAVPRTKPGTVDSDESLLLLKTSGLIDVEMVSFWCNAFTGDGLCLMGAVDPRKFDPASLNVVPVTPLPAPNDSLWNVKLDRLECRGEGVFDGDIDFVLDTGSSRFKGDRRYIEKIKCAITNDWELDGVIKGGDPDFDPYPNLYLDIHGETYTLKPSQYFMEVSPGVWELAFHPMDGLEGILLVGSVFLDAVYSIFYNNAGSCGEGQSVGLAVPLF
ncbi:MAG: hypothetical protein GY950_12220 [bacterium]|nr:hypothetical protein [bacterium]